jgi:hypothetical protein
MTDMIDRVAKAMFVASGGNPENYMCLNPDIWHQPARAAIVAMREPTRKMVSAAYDDTNAMDQSWAWQAMIDAALEEKK